MDISTVRAIMEAARARRPPEEPPRFVMPEIENEPIRQISGPGEPEPVEAEYVNIESMRASAEVAKQKRIAEILEFETLCARGQAVAPTNHPSGRPWLEGERRLPHHLVPGYEHLPRQPITLTSSKVEPDTRTKDFYAMPGSLR